MRPHRHDRHPYPHRRGDLRRLAQGAATVKASTDDQPYRARVITHGERPWLRRSLAGDLMYGVHHGWSKAFSRATSHVDVVLYPPDAPAGALPIIVVPVQSDAPVQRVSRGDVIHARGLPVPGDNVVLAACWRHRVVLDAAAHLLGGVPGAAHSRRRLTAPFTRRGVARRRASSPFSRPAKRDSVASPRGGGVAGPPEGWTRNLDFWTGRSRAAWPVRCPAGPGTRCAAGRAHRGPALRA